MTIALGWWALPLIVTMLSFGAALTVRPSSFIDPGPAFAGVGALIASLVAWLIWAVLT